LPHKSELETIKKKKNWLECCEAKNKRLKINKQLRKAPVPHLATWSKHTTQSNLNSGGITEYPNFSIITTNIGALR
jgi:hypothetical protein